MALTPTTEGLVMSVLLVGAALGSAFWRQFADYSAGVNIYSFSPLFFSSARCFPPRPLISLPC
ncbi:hypothetical protein LN650_16350 [Klebsiella pneumoniae subsp. pneumoniae]|nr:hypothetical protein [Klebsiella pneumoniae subsp. pneumoniae]